MTFDNGTTVAAYVISEVEMTDREAFERYRALAPATIAKYGGRYLVRAGATELVEGGPPPRQIVIVEFASMEHARTWYRSPEYAEALRFRKDGLDRRLIFAEGLPVTAFGA
jgi:uncharacterized protein (DUF1330 family)